MLNGKPVYLIDYYPYGPKDKMVTFTKPRGVKEASGEGSVQRSATLIRGIPPGKPIYSNTGAVDDIITAKGNKIEVTSVKDEAVKRKRGRPRKDSTIDNKESQAVRDKENRRMNRIMKPAPMVDSGDGIVFNPKTGRGHLKL
jgi:hypothetical protein